MKKIIRPFVISMLGMIFLALGVAAFLPDHYKISRRVEIHSSSEKIFPMVAKFSRWKEWSPWYESEPNAEYVQEGIDGEIGNKMTWNGRIIGKGSITLEKIQSPYLVLVKLIIESPRYSESDFEITLQSQENRSQVTWTNTGPLPYPMGRLFGPFLDKIMGKDFERGLANLKKAVEK